jgi:hypothetical protein
MRANADAVLSYLISFLFSDYVLALSSIRAIVVVVPPSSQLFQVWATSALSLVCCAVLIRRSLDSK